MLCLQFHIRNDYLTHESLSIVQIPYKKNHIPLELGQIVMLARWVS